MIILKHYELAANLAAQLQLAELYEYLRRSAAPGKTLAETQATSLPTGGEIIGWTGDNWWLMTEPAPTLRLPIKSNRQHCYCELVISPTIMNKYHHPISYCWKGGGGRLRCFKTSVQRSSTQIKSNEGEGGGCCKWYEEYTYRTLSYSSVCIYRFHYNSVFSRRKTPGPPQKQHHLINQSSIDLQVTIQHIDLSGDT